MRIQPKYLLAMLASAFCLFFFNPVYADMAPTQVPLNKSNHSAQEISAWAKQAIIAINTYDYINYTQQLQAASQYFTSRGWKAYSTALEKSGNLKAVMDNKMMVAATSKHIPLVLQQGLLKDGTYAWKVQIPLKITYQTAYNAKTQNTIVTMLIKRTAALPNTQGIGIDQLTILNAK